MEPPWNHHIVASSDGAYDCSEHLADRDTPLGSVYAATDLLRARATIAAVDPSAALISLCSARRPWWMKRCGSFSRAIRIVR